MKNQSDYDKFIQGFCNVKLTKWQRILLLSDKIIHHNSYVRSRHLYEQIKIATAVNNAILNEETKVAIIDAKGKLKIPNIENMISLKDIEYKIENEKIIFENGSVVEILKIPKGSETIKGKSCKNIMYYH